MSDWRSKLSRSLPRFDRKCRWHLTAHRKRSHFLKIASSSRVKAPFSGKLIRGIGGIDVLGDPEQRVEIAQAALSVFHVRLDQVPAFTHLEVAEVTFAQLDGNEFLGALRNDLSAEIGDQPFKEDLVSTDESRLQDGRENGIIRLRKPYAFVDVPCGVPNLLTRIP